MYRLENKFKKKPFEGIFSKKEASIYLCGLTAPVVQWIEFQIPVLTMGVRVPSGAQKIPHSLP